jgi:hypothetical protein
MTLRKILKRYPAQTLAAAAFLGFLVGRALPLRLIASYQEARHGHRSCFSWLSGRIPEGQCCRFRLLLKIAARSDLAKTKSPDRITSPGFALC